MLVCILFLLCFFAFVWLVPHIIWHIAHIQYHVIKHSTIHAEVFIRGIHSEIKLKELYWIVIVSSVPLWPSGASTLDPEMCGRYKLSVMVKDMAGKANAFFTTGIVTVEVTGNTWASPDPVRLQENLPGPYPIPISQVRLQNPDQHVITLKHFSTNFHFTFTLKPLLLIWFLP